MNDSDSRSSCSRRDFLRRSALGLGAALTLPTVSGLFTPDEPARYFEYWRTIRGLPEHEKLGIALVGLGNYSTHQLAPALQETKLCRLAGVVTGTPEKEVRWAEQYDIAEANIYNYETYDRIADNPEIDIVYIVLPNGMHAEYSIRGARAGKHVICEKPMATTVEDCRAIITACEEADRKLSIGYRLHFEPYNEEAMRLGQSHVLGAPTAIAGDLSFRYGGSPDDWRLDRKMAGGGPLLDIGVYVIQGAIYTLGELPVSVIARTETQNQQLFHDVEETVYWQMEFPGGAVLDASSSYGANANFLRVRTEDGHFSLEPAYTYGPLGGETSRGPLEFPHVNQQALQMDAFADHILNGRPNRVPGEMGLRDNIIMAAIYEAAETERKVRLSL